LDIWPAFMLNGPDKAYALALRAVLEDPHVDGVMGVAIGPKLPDYPFLDVTGKPAAAWLYGPNTE